MMVTASLLAAMALAISLVPTAKLGISNTPMGPFQTMVLALAISSEKSLTVSGPMSRPSRSSGISPHLTVVRGASLSNSGAQTVSTGRSIFTPFCSALASREVARSSLSASSRDLPILPPWALEKV